MASSLATITILALAFGSAVVRADVSHLGYNRYSRPASTRLQRLEGSPTPYPAAGYRPNKVFNLPREQPIFPLGNSQQQPQEHKQFNNNNGGFNSNNNNAGFNNNNAGFNSNNNNGGFDVLSEPQQPEQPQLTYGAPSRFRQAPARVQQQQQQQQQPQLVYNSPQLTYGAPQQQEPQEQSAFQPQPQPENQNTASGFNNLAEPQSQPQPQAQRPDLLYGAPARFRQAPARLQQPQQLYATPQAGRLTNAQSGRFTDDREDEEDEDDTTNPEASSEIETESKKDEGKKAPAQNVAIAYYPAGAFSFVQPISGAYVAAAPGAAYVTAAGPSSAAYVTAQNAFVATQNAAFVTAPKAVYQPFASPFLQQPFTFGAAAAAPAQLRAW